MAFFCSSSAGNVAVSVLQIFECHAMKKTCTGKLDTRDHFRYFVSDDPGTAYSVGGLVVRFSLFLFCRKLLFDWSSSLLIENRLLLDATVAELIDTVS